MSFLRNMPLARKIITISFLVALSAWSILDVYQTRKLRNIFNDRLDAVLQEQAREDRGLFDEYIRSFGRASRILVSQKKTNDYLSSSTWKNTRDKTILHDSLPQWLPSSSVLRSLPLVRFFILLDGNGDAKEIYANPSGSIPAPLQHPAGILRQLSHNQTYLTLVEGTPFILASERLMLDGSDEVSATLILASPINDVFLSSSLDSLRRDNLVALVDNQSKKIIASSHPERIRSGSFEDDFKTNYLITGKSFFDYGSSDLQAHFISLIAKSQYDSLSREILKTGRINRAITGLVLLLCLTSVLMYIILHINNLKKSMDTFAEEKLGADSRAQLKGDQLHLLENRFQDLKDEVLDAQEKLETEAQKNIILIRENLEMQQHQKLLGLLQAVTDELSIGVIIFDGSDFKAANDKMRSFIEHCGGLEEFIYIPDQANHKIIDHLGQEQIFHVTKPRLRDIENDIILVQEVTARKNAEEERERLIAKLQKALGKVKQLSGFLPICASCKKIRDDSGYWNQIESYIKEHSEAEFSHGICPECKEKLYPELAEIEKTSEEKQ